MTSRNELCGPGQLPGVWAPIYAGISQAGVGSLQRQGDRISAQRLYDPDPYSVSRSGNGANERISRPDTRANLPKALELPGNAPLRNTKPVAKFVGRVDALGSDSARVSLLNEATGEQLESQCDAEVLRQNGIGAGEEFCCEVFRSCGITFTRLYRLPPKELSKQRVEEIHSQFQDRWTF